jgi:hypothetical protein
MSSRARSKKVGTKNAAQGKTSVSPFTSMAVIVVVLAISVASAVITMVMLKDILSSLAVFIFVLLVLMIALPYVGMMSGSISSQTWFKTYVRVLGKVPGLDSILNALGAKKLPK